MTREWAPGDVALVRNEYNVWNVAICTLRANRPGWWWRYGVADSWSPITADARPLVVLDPDSPEDQRRLLDRLRKSGAFRGVVSQDVALDCIGDALRSLLTPPKPEEPTGLGAVVEDAEGVKWIRTHDTLAPWLRHNFSGSRYWNGIAAVRVLSEGVTP